MKGVDVNQVAVIAAQLCAVPVQITIGILIALTGALVLIVAYWSLTRIDLSGSFRLCLHLLLARAPCQVFSAKQEGWARSRQEVFHKRLRATAPACELGYFVHALPVPSRKDRKVQVPVHVRDNLCLRGEGCYVDHASGLHHLLSRWWADRTSGTGIDIIESSILDIAG